MSKPLVLASAALAVLIAGCLEPARDTSYQAYGSKGSYTTGFAYNGKGIVPFDGAVYLDVDEEQNTGRLVADGKIGSTPFVVTFDRFAQSKPFHDGGIAADLVEHGDSGVGDTSIPRVDMEMAGWGKATIKYGGKSYADPVTGNESWTAHFMVIRNGVRDNATGGIYADAEKTTPYNSKEPQKGISAPSDYEIHLVLRNGTTGKGASSGAGGMRSSGPGAGPTLNEDFALFTSDELGANALVNLTVADSITRGSNVTFTLTSPSGVVVLEQTLGDASISPGTGTATRGIGVKIQEIGEYRMTVDGQLNPGGRYQIDYDLLPPTAVVLNLWWEDILFGLDAQEHARADGLISGPTSSSASSMTGTMNPTSSGR
jgi:hypothetical protein